MITVFDIHNLCFSTIVHNPIPVFVDENEWNIIAWRALPNLINVLSESHVRCPCFWELALNSR